jgi:hypothetical protein
MQNQKDHVDAYAFLMARMTSALVAGEVSNPEAPARRASLGLLIGVGVAALAVAGFFIFGLIVEHSGTGTPNVRVTVRAPGIASHTSGVVARGALAPALVSQEG